ncbi:MAG: hypothetical protein ABSE91_02710 [Patescibacteria group bacterium]|jgi:hypothetical protein
MRRQMNQIIISIILMFYGAALGGFLISCACFSAATRLRANLWILAMVLGIFVLSWIGFAIS